LFDTVLPAVDGLASRAIFHLLYDSRGFIWFSARNELSGDDGREFMNFRLFLPLFSRRRQTDILVWRLDSALPVLNYKIKKLVQQKGISGKIPAINFTHLDFNPKAFKTTRCK
jgi:hypothetical protein